MLPLAVLVLISAPLSPLPEGTGQVVITIVNQRSTTGQLLCDLFTNGTGFPGKSPLQRGQVKATMVDGQAVCRFDALPAGTFAVNVIHDENANGAFDKNFFGIPVEGYGFTNNPTARLSAPSFEAASFTLSAGEQKRFSVTLTY